AHAWRVPLRSLDHRALLPLLSADERARAERFMRDRDAEAFIVAHGTLRRVLARYLDAAPDTLAFITGPHGKPALASREGRALEFNLSHSGDLALIAVARAGPVGIDVECRNRDVEHLRLAEHFFSPAERTALRALARELDSLTEGFFNAWTRKEAYLKATGYGITRGLHHFDVSIAPGEPAALLGDRLDPSATDRWRLSELRPGAGFQAALVVPRVVDEITLYDAD
ncbi:MAG: 4'-phosphopantetheinyl transferase family protein, partial [Gemmatimonadaceae bacterium]